MLQQNHQFLNCSHSLCLVWQFPPQNEIARLASIIFAFSREFRFFELEGLVSENFAHMSCHSLLLATILLAWKNAKREQSETKRDKARPKREQSETKRDKARI